MELNINESSNKHKLCLLLKLIILTIPVAWGIYVVWKYGVNVCYLDEWTYMIHHENFFSWSYLWAQHNEHRMFFPKIIAYVVGLFFSWNSKVFMYTSQIFLLVLYYIVIRMVLDGKCIKDICWSDAVESLLIGLCIYNAAQLENLLWGFQIAWFLIVSLGALSYYYFDKYLKTDSNKFLIISMFFAIIVSFSSLHGLTVWGGYIGIVIISLLIRKRLMLKTYIIICTTCIISVFLYFYGWKGVSGHSQYAGEGTDQILSFFLGQVGASLLPNRNILSYLAGFLLVIITGLIVIKIIIEKKVNENIIYIGPIIMSLGSMFIISLGRSNGATGSHIASRYVTNSMLFLTFFMLICIKELRLAGTQKGKDNCFRADMAQQFVCMMTQVLPHLGGFLFVCISTLVVCRNTGIIDTLDAYYQRNMWAKIVLVNYEDMEPGDYSCLHPNPEKVSAFFDEMKTNRINVFSDNNEDIDFRETSIPDKDIEKVIDSSVFNANCISLYDKSIRINISNFGNIKKADLKKLKFYVSINGIVYNALWNNDMMRFVKNKSVLNEGNNTCQIFFASKDTLYVSKEISIFKNGDEILFLDSGQKDNSFLGDYREVLDNRKYSIDKLNDQEPTDEIVLENMSQSSVSGWIQIAGTNGKTCYLKIGNAYFELNWVTRQDVIKAYNDSGYSGFGGYFMPTSMKSGLYSVSIIIVDDDEKTYFEQKTPYYLHISTDS